MRVLLIFLCWLWALPVAAQSWQASTSDDGGYAAGWIRFPNLPFSAMCMARSVQNRPIGQTSWIESTIAPPWHFRVSASNLLIPGAVAPRGDILLVVDQTGYQLPVLNWNEMDGDWQVNIAMNDQMMLALRRASRLVLRVGSQQAWEIPTAGLGSALDQAQAFCAATWNATGTPGPAGLTAAPPGGLQGQRPQNNSAAAPDPRAIAQGHINRQCEGQGRAGPNAVTFGDIDADGAQDILIDWSDVSCSGQMVRPFCGASLCGGDVLLSRNNYVYRQGDAMLGMGHEMIPLDNGNQGVRSPGNFSICQSQDPCGYISYWDGVQLQAYRYGG